MGGKPVVETAKQIDAEMDKSEYRPPHRNCTPLGSHDPLGDKPLRNALVCEVSRKRIMRS